MTRSGVFATEIFGINDKGQLTGDYVDADGNVHGFIGDRVPGPASLPLLPTGIAGLAAVRRRGLGRKAYAFASGAINIW